MKSVFAISCTRSGTISATRNTLRVPPPSHEHAEMPAKTAEIRNFAHARGVSRPCTPYHRPREFLDPWTRERNPDAAHRSARAV
ncbi:Uncharacterised protein [Mycobacteroides abscessus subsp. abscessus]|nr:Uncharacterised protein [Mycobacteroides abscessus subsp. abscessus]